MKKDNTSRAPETENWSGKKNNVFVKKGSKLMFTIVQVNLKTLVHIFSNIFIANRDWKKILLSSWTSCTFQGDAISLWLSNIDQAD